MDKNSSWRSLNALATNQQWMHVVYCLSDRISDVNDPEPGDPTTFCLTSNGSSWHSLTWKASASLQYFLFINLSYIICLKWAFGCLNVSKYLTCTFIKTKELAYYQSWKLIIYWQNSATPKSTKWKSNLPHQCFPFEACMS